MIGKGTDQAAAWIYRGIWAGLVRAFRVPDRPPLLPVREGESLESFRPAPGFLRYLKFHFWVLLIPGDILPIAGAILTFLFMPVLGVALVPVFLAIAVVPDIIAYIAIHLRYDTTWYVFTDRSLRIRRGIFTIRETTITFENVQEVNIQQGPLQRLFGISNLVVETAGGGAAHAEKGATQRPHVGILEGLDNAPMLRDRIMAKVQRSAHAGLGDEPHGYSAADPQGGLWTPAHVEALREIRDLIRSTLLQTKDPDDAAARG